MENSLFIIDKQTNIVLYGASAMGLLAYNSLKRINGYNVIGFIDLRADEIKSQVGLPVWDIHSVPFNENEKKNILIVVSVKNVFDHNNIVGKLIDLGFENFIFKPLDNINDATYNSINYNYNCIFNDENVNLKYNLKNINKIFNSNNFDFKDYALIYKENDHIVANIPLASIYCSPKQYKDEKSYLNKKPITCLYALINLYELWNGINGNIEDYLNFCISGAINTGNILGGEIKQTDSWKLNILRSRLMVYENMQNMLALDHDFFIKNCPTAYFADDLIMMNSGKNRAIFLLTKKIKYMPLCLSKDDYNRYLNMTALKRLFEYINSHKNIRIKTPIPHPYFYRINMNCEYPAFYETVVYSTIKFLSEYYNIAYSDSAQCLDIIDFLDDNGALARCLVKVFKSVTKFIEHTEFIEYHSLLDELLFTTELQYCTSFCKNRYHIGIFEQRHVDFIADMGLELCIIISEKVALFDGFTLVKKLLKIFWDTKIMEVNVYVRNR